MSVVISMKLRVSTLAAFLFLVAFVFTGVKSFSAWPQVIELWQGGVSLESLIGHPHFFRYIIAYPGLALETRYPGFGFSFYCSLYLIINARLWAEIIWKTGFFKPSLIGWCIFFSAHLAMNGRGVIAWSAWLMCISLCVDLSRLEVDVKWFATRLFLSCFLAAVSTGVFVVALVSIIYFVMIYWRSRGGGLLGAKAVFFCISALPFFYIFIDYFIVAIEKNLDFYGGGMRGVLKMLDHGLGQFVLSIDYFGFLALIFFIFFFMIVMVIMHLGVKISPIKKLLVISVFGGMFGFTVLTLAIPLLLCELEAFRRYFLKSIVFSKRCK